MVHHLQLNRLLERTFSSQCSIHEGLQVVQELTQFGDRKELAAEHTPGPNMLPSPSLNFNVGKNEDLQKKVVVQWTQTL